MVLSKFKRLLALLLAIVMMFTLVGCNDDHDRDDDDKRQESNKDDEDDSWMGSDEAEEVVIDGITYHKALDLTKDEITLTYFHFDQDETVQALAERFMEIYPNITVNVIYENIATHKDKLLAYNDNGQLPDVFMYSDCDFVLAQNMLADITRFYDADPETQNLADTISECGLGCYSTDVRWAVPVRFFPGVMYVDRNAVDTLGQQLPAKDWTWAEMIRLIKDCTIYDRPEGEYYGLGYYNRLDSYYQIAADQAAVGEFGFDGTDFDLKVWAIGEQEFANLKMAGYVAPVQGTLEMEAWLGDAYAWCGATGRVAVFAEPFWTYQNLWATEAYQGYGLDIVPYVVPAVSEEDASVEHRTMATIDFGGVSATCDYPREAYELLKFMSFGVDGWKTRISLYKDETIVNAVRMPLKYDQMPVPITKDEEIWKAYIDMFCADMDMEHKALWEDYFASCMQPIPYSWASIVGLWDYSVEYFNKLNFHELVDCGSKKATEIVEEATIMANYYHAQAMLSYFGPGGYDVLSKDEIAQYDEMIIRN